MFSFFLLFVPPSLFPPFPFLSPLSLLSLLLYSLFFLSSLLSSFFLCTFSWGQRGVASIFDCKTVRANAYPGASRVVQWWRLQQPVQETYRCGFDPWVRKIPWRRAWQPTPVVLPGESPWTEEPSGLQSMGSQRVGDNWRDLAGRHRHPRSGNEILNAIIFFPQWFFFPFW